jgi:hypothetical protein
MENQLDAGESAWEAGRKYGLEEAARRVEQMGGEYSSLLSPGVVARDIRALKE